jgi:hypothetical protein
VEPSFAVTVAVTLASLGYWYWASHVIEQPTMSGDKWYMRQMAFTDQPISPPYCWRPLVPALARRLGFHLVSYSASVATPIVIYFMVGGGWTGTACALLFVGNNNIFTFNVKCPEYAESVGQLLMIGSVWAVSVDSVLAWPLLLLSALCRETIAAALGLIVLFWNPWLLIPLAVGSAVAYLGRQESKDHRHPLIEGSAYDTLVRWARKKGAGVSAYPHVIQPLRGVAITVPFMWGSVGGFSRLGLLGFLGIWLLAVPASGQSRIMCYGFVLVLPFVAALPGPWLWFLVFATWFWPIDLYAFEETGGDKTWGFIR